MHPTPPSGHNQPYGHGQQPYPQQPPHPQQGGYGQPPHPQQGGYGHPQQPVPQGPPGYGQPQGPPPPYPAPLAPDTMPGQATTVRVLMFIGGACGILLGLLFGVILLFGVGLGVSTASEINDPEFNTMMGVFGALGLIMALIPLVYGIASTWLAAVMGRRKSGVYWGVVIFNILASLFLVFGIILSLAVEEPPTGIIPLAFHATMTGLMFSSKVKAFYGR